MSVPGATTEEYLKPLSAREEEILRLAADGRTDKEIALVLAISIGTIKTYWERMRIKTGAASRSEVIAKVIQDAFREAVAAAREAEQKYKLIFEASPAAIAVLDAYGILLEANLNFGVMAGRYVDDLRGRPYDDLVADRPFQELWDEGSLPEVITLVAGGQRIDVMRTVHSIYQRGERRLLISLIDVSTIERSRRNAERVRALEQATMRRNTAVLFLNRKGLILLLSDEAEELLGGTRFDLVGRRIHTLVAPHQQDQLVRLLEQVAREPFSQSVATVQRYDGKDPGTITMRLINCLNDHAVRAIMVELDVIEHDVPTHAAILGRA
jgi:PAS domain S-box-containing protein